MGWPNENYQASSAGFPRPWAPDLKLLPLAVPRPRVKNFPSKGPKETQQGLIDFTREPLVKSPAPEKGKKKPGKLALRALSKFYSINLAKALAEVPNTRLKGQYLKSAECGQDIIIEGDKAYSTYCGYRWCRTCNRIRAAKLIDKYSPALEAMGKAQFITVSIRNVKSNEILKDSNKFILHTAHQIKDLMRKAGLVLYGFRKFEITINDKEKSFHPHLHLLIDARIKAPEHSPKKYKELPELQQCLAMVQDIWVKYHLGIFDLKRILNKAKETGSYSQLAAETFIRLWLNYTEHLSSSRAQDVRQANKNSLKELFKYGVKTIVKDTSHKTVIINQERTYINDQGDIITQVKKIKSKAPLVVNLEMLDRIYTSIQGLRVLQNFGYTKAECAEFNELAAGQIEENLKAQDYNIQPQASSAEGEPAPQIIYTWQQWNWHHTETGQPLTDYEPGRYEAKLLESLEKARDRLKEKPG